MRHKIVRNTEKYHPIPHIFEWRLAI